MTHKGEAWSILLAFCKPVMSFSSYSYLNLAVAMLIILYHFISILILPINPMYSDKLCQMFFVSLIVAKLDK